MASTLQLFVNLSAPASNSLVSGFNLLSKPATPEFVLRDTVRVEIRFLTVAAGSRTGVAADVGEDVSLRLGGKLASTYTTVNQYLFFSDTFTRDDDDEDDIFYYADLNLNTAEFIAAFTGATTNIAIKTEIEIGGESSVQTAAQFDATGVFDVIRGGEGLPTPAVPAYPTTPVVDTFFGAELVGGVLSWVQRTVAQSKTKLALAIGDISGLVSALAAKLSDAPTDGTIYARKDGAWVRADSIESTNVADETERLALTIDDVQGGDYVKQLDTGVLYEVTDATKLAPGMTPEDAFTALATLPWGAITDNPFSGYTPTSLPINDATQESLDLKASAAALVSEASTRGTTDGALATSIATKAPLASPTFTGTPTAPTADPDTDSQQIATTGFAKGEADAAQAAAIAAAATDATTKANAAQAAAIAASQPLATVLTNTTAAFTTAQETKLSGIASGATANSTDAALLARANHTGTQSADTLTDGTTNKAFLATEKTKLAAISGSNTGDQDLTAAPVSTAQSAAIVRAQNRLRNFLNGGFSGKKLVMAGDSTMLQMSVSRLKYHGAAIYRPFIGTATLTRSGTTVTTSSALFQSSDVGGTVYFNSGGSSLITGFTDAGQITVADSGTIPATNGYILINGSFTGYAGSKLGGLTVYHCGDNGQSAAGNVGGSGFYPLSYLLTLNADCYLFGYGINDVRQNGQTLAQLTSSLTAQVEAVRASVPNADIILRIPNTLLTTDGGSYITPPSSAQAYSDRMRDAYLAQDNRWPNVYVWNTRKDTWGGDTCYATAPSWMADALHPTINLGQDALMDNLVNKVIGQPSSVLSVDFGRALLATLPSTAWTVYPEALEDSAFYTKVFEGKMNGGGSGYTDLSPLNLSINQSLRIGDIIYQDGTAPFVATVPGSNNGGVTGYVRLLMTAPVTLTGGARTRVYRPIGYGSNDALLLNALPDIYPIAVPIIFGACGSNFMRIQANPDNAISRLNLINISNDCYITCPDLPAISLTSMSSRYFFSDTDNGLVVVNINGSYSAYAGKVGMVFMPARIISPSLSTWGTYASGAAYSLTATPALLGFGTTTPSATLGTFPNAAYSIRARAQLKANGATTAGETVTLKIRKTSGTPADITNSSRTITLPALTTATQTVGVVETKEVIYTAAAGDVIQLWGSISAGLSAGTIDAVDAELIVQRLY